MLNRRLLRIKVMQALYALKQAEESNFYNAIAIIEEEFAPDLNSMEPEKPEVLEERKKKATAIFEERFKTEDISGTNEGKVILDAVLKGFNYHRSSLKKDQKHYRKLMHDDLDNIYEEYLLLLLLLKKVSKIALEHDEEQKSRHIKEVISLQAGKKFSENALVSKIVDNEDLEKERVKKNLTWENDLLRKLYKSEIVKDPEFIEYVKSESSDFEADKKIIVHIFKNIVFKSDMMQNYFEEKDLSWLENKSIISGLVVKTIKEATEVEEIKLLQLSPNWDEDKDFYIELFEKTIGIEDTLEEIISKKATNWDIDRIASTDNIILKMALTEMMHFPSIPVKVTINEYIELSKNYSTPKSKKFVNGLLDSLALELKEKGMIKKSGRGLIDNK